MKKPLNFKEQVLPHIISVLIILSFSCALFYPQLSGMEVAASDSISSVAKTKVVVDYKKENGEYSYWNSSQFSGGPIYLLNLGRSSNLLGKLHKVFTLNKMKGIGMFFALGIIMYLSLCLAGVNKWLSLSVTFAYMLSLIFFTLFEAGHNKKVHTLTYLPLVISGLILLFNNKIFKGGLALILGTSLALYTGHVQMVYYLILSLIVFGLPFLIFAIKDKRLKSFLPGLSAAIIIAVIAASTNFAQLYSSQSFSKQTMRGGAVLNKAKDDTDINKEGLQWDYSMSWSYEISDFLNILVPRIKGGGSQEMVDKENDLAKLMIKNNAPVKNNKVGVPGYWGTMPFTSGGAYLGASLFLLFILSFFLLKRELSIGFGLAFLVIFLLSLGENAEWLNRFLFNSAPLFDKFRAPSSAVSILPAFVAIFSALGLNELILKRDEQKFDKKILYATAVLATFLIIILGIGLSSFNYLSPNDANYPYEIQEILKSGRQAMFKADALRSLGFVIATGVLLFLFAKNILKHKLVFLVLLSLLFIIDILPIDRRYVNKDDFMPKALYAQKFNPRPADLQISKSEPNGRAFYRVLDLSVNTFNDALPAYHHNQIGGYDPAKLQRYQDLIDYHISKNNFKVLNMLNMKYIITKDGKVQVNPDANGNAWFVNKIKTVDSDLAEIEALNDVNLKETAVIKLDEFPNLKAGDGDGSITLVKGKTNELVYNSSSPSNQLAVFSEIWYGGQPDWEVTIDGEKATLVRANYILRALEIPAGEHEIVMIFKPKAKGSLISLAASILAVLFVIYAILIIAGLVSNPLKKSDEQE